MYLITDAYLTERFNISKHLDTPEITEALANVTEFHVKKLLGKPLYKLYLNHIENATTLTAKQAELYELIKLYFGLMVKYELMYKLFDITAKGNQTEPSAASIEMVQLKRNSEYAKASIAKEDIKKFLEANKADFPEYFPDVTSTSTGYSPLVYRKEPKKWYGI